VLEIIAGVILAVGVITFLVLCAYAPQYLGK
jgi:hypothetical protein